MNGFDEKKWRRYIVGLKRQGQSVSAITDQYFMTHAREILADDFNSWGEDYQSWAEQVFDFPGNNVQKLIDAIADLALPEDAKDEYWDAMDDLVQSFKGEDLEERAPVMGKEIDQKKWRRQRLALKRQEKTADEDVYFKRFARDILADDFDRWRIETRGEGWEPWAERVLAEPNDTVENLLLALAESGLSQEEQDDYWNTLEDIVNDFEYENIAERQLAPVFTPSQHQKAVLAKIITSVTDKVAGEEISRDANMVAARDVLVKLGYINYNRGRANLTPKGEQLARDEGVWDEMGQLTPQGEEHSRGEDEGEKYGPTVEAFARRVKSSRVFKKAFEKGLEEEEKLQEEPEDNSNRTKELFDLFTV